MILRVPPEIFLGMNSKKYRVATTQTFFSAKTPIFSDLSYEIQLFLRLPAWKNSTLFLRLAKSMHIFKTKIGCRLKGRLIIHTMVIFANAFTLTFLINLALYFHLVIEINRKCKMHQSLSSFTIKLSQKFMLFKFKFISFFYFFHFHF